MEADKKFSVKSRLRSFRYAANGLKILLRNEHNARVHAAAAAIAIVAGAFLRLSVAEWLMIVFAIGLVFVTELLNTAVEYICNWLSPEYREEVRAIKDLAAGAVLVSAAVAVMIAAGVFGMRVYALIG